MIRGVRGVGTGRLAALGSASSFAMVSTLAGLAYAGGATPPSVIAARLLFGLLATCGAVIVLRRPWMVPRREWGATFVISIAWLAVNVCYMASFYFIPVSLSVLIFFTFPVLIAVIGPFVSRERPGTLTVVAALTAFAGLGFALGPEVGTLDWRGCAFAFAAALGVMSTFLMSRRLVVEQDMFTFSFNLHLLCGVAAAAWIFVNGGIALPSGVVPFTALFGVGAFFSLAVLLQFAAIRFAGPSRASIVFNAEPLITVVGAALVLGESLGPGQAVGAALVIGGVLLSTRTDTA